MLATRDVREHIDEQRNDVLFLRYSADSLYRNLMNLRKKSFAVPEEKRTVGLTEAQKITTVGPRVSLSNLFHHLSIFM